MTKLPGTPVRIAAVAAVLALVAFAAGAQTPPRLLSDVDVVKFIHDFKQLGEELNQLGSDVAPDVENAMSFGAMLTGLRANAQVQRVLAKYGWGDATFSKFAAVLASYFVVKLEQAQQDSSAEMARAVAEIDRSPQLSAEQKAAFKAQMTAVSQQLTQLQATYRAQVHPDDMAVVRAHIAELDAAFDE
jgi:hypothetical protein